jgi:hypothetical protein
MSTYEHSPEVKRIIEEMNALNAVLTATTPTLRVEAREKVRSVEAASPEPATVEEVVLRTAMSRIAGTDPPGVTPKLTEGAPWVMRAFELIGLAWLAWARGDAGEATSCIVEWAEEEEARNSSVTEYIRDGAVQLYSVSLWATAVSNLLAGRTEEARRYYQRVHDVGASFGTESHPVILWTMAASFTPAD